MLDCRTQDNNYHITAFVPFGYNQMYLNIERTSPYKLLSMGPDNIKLDKNEVLIYAKKTKELAAQITLNFTADAKNFLGAQMKINNGANENLNCRMAPRGE